MRYVGFPWTAGMLCAWEDGSKPRRLADHIDLKWCVDGDGKMRYPQTDGVPVEDDACTIGGLLGAVEAAYPEWFAVSLQYRGSAEAWYVIGRKRHLRDRGDHRVLGEGATKFAALWDAWGKRGAA